MSPRRGGEADKFGARYEGAWTVSYLLHILAGEGAAITVEVAGEIDDGAEFLYTRATDGVVEAHQLKRQNGTANNWTIRALQGEDIWTNAKAHIDAGREFHFVSTVPSAVLAELTDRARRSASLDHFVKSGWLTDTLRPTFDQLTKTEIYGSPEAAWTMLRGMWFRCQDERAVVSTNAALGGVLLEGASGQLAALGLGDMVMQHIGVELTASLIGNQLAAYGLQRASHERSKDLGQTVGTITQHWRDSVGRELLSPSIKRDEARTLVTLAGDVTSPITFLVGTAGGGKSAVLAQAVDQLLSDNVPVLGFRLDRLGHFGTTEELGQKLGLAVSPVSALASTAADQPSVLVVDQLDAVSLASGRMPSSFSAVEDLVREAGAFPGMHVVLVCRQFDVDNDYRIRTLRADLKAETLTVPPLSDEAVVAAVHSMGLDPSKLLAGQRELLRLALHLVLLASVADQPDALNFQTTAHLFDAYWRRKRQAIEQRKPGVRFMAVMTTVTTAISDRQQLSVSDSVLDAGELADDGDVFISEHVLVGDGNRIAFFHEAFFDYAFARQWATGNQTLIDFLTAGEQELFRRAQVRQILHHVRGRDTSRYLAELKPTLTSPRIRFHIKEAMLAALGAVTDPTSAELKIVLDAAATSPDVTNPISQMLRSPSWFTRLDQEGQLQRWLNTGTAEEHRRAVDLLGNAAQTYPDRIAAILSAFKGHPEYYGWLLWTVRFAELHTSRALFELVLEAVRNGAASGRERELWPSMYTLADHEPVWAIELIAVYFIEWPGGLDLAADGNVERLSLSEHALAEMIQKAAVAEPAKFVETVLPYMTDAMKVAASHNKPPGFPTDPHFSHYDGEMSETSDVDDALHGAMRLAIEQIVRTNPAAAESVLERLAAIRLSGAQSLLYIGLIAGGEQYADWSADLLLQGVDRLFCGLMSNSVWVARQLIETIAPHISNAKHQAIEDAVRDLRFDWEGRRGGYYAFTLLSALDAGRLTATGTRRLGEYQRKFNAESPAEPEGVTGGGIGAPIASKAFTHMTDENWLQAMKKHDADRTNWTTFTGGARELGHVLQQQTKEDPRRFARLALQLNGQMNNAYGDAILLGLGEAAAVAPEQHDIVFAAIRHIASLGEASNDRWLGYALRPYLKTAPLDLVEVIRDRAVSATDPVDDRYEYANERHPGENLRSAGLNSARGSAVEELGNLLVFDVDGSRTAAVVPALDSLAADPVISVRAQAAHTIAAALRYARREAIAAFSTLVDTDDTVLAGQFVRRLMIYVGNGGDHEIVIPVIQRMINSDDAAVRQCGGELSLVAALEWAAREPLEQVMTGFDAAARKGVAQAAAARLSSNRDAELAAATLISLFNDPEVDVREAAARVAPNLRGEALGPYESALMALINSAAFEPSVPQLFLTLQHAPDEVGALVLRSAQRFIEVFGPAAGDIRTGAAGNTRYVCDLVIRGLAQSQDPAERSALLDVVDELMKAGAHGVDDAVNNAGR